MGRIQGSHNQRRDLAQSWFEKARRDCDEVQFLYGWVHATVTTSPAGQSCNYMDSSWWPVKKGALEDDMLQNISERLGDGPNHMGGSWRCCNGPVKMATNCCSMCRIAQQELSLNSHYLFITPGSIKWVPALASPVSVVSQCKLMSGWGQRKWRSLPSSGPMWFNNMLLLGPLKCHKFTRNNQMYICGDRILP